MGCFSGFLAGEVQPGVHVPPTPLIPLQLLLSGTPARSSCPAYSTHTAPTPSLRYSSQEFTSRPLHSYCSNSFSHSGTPAKSSRPAHSNYTALTPSLRYSSQEFTTHPLHLYCSNSFSQVLQPWVHVPPTQLILLQLLLSGTSAKSSCPAYSTHTTPTRSLRYFSQEFTSRLLHLYRSNSFSRVL